MDNNNHILVVDDEPLTRKSLYEILKFQGYRVSAAGDGEAAFKIVKEQSPDIVITDLKMPKIDGLTLLKEIKSISPDTAVVLITAFGSIENAVEAMKDGAFDYITKPIIDNEIQIVIKRILEQKRILQENKILKKQLSEGSRGRFHDFIGQSPAMNEVFSLISKVAGTDASVLILGENGTGKELVARELHRQSERANEVFIAVDMGALSETLFESELFGHVKGAFTGATETRAGFFQTADGGTIFLDEISETSPSMQVKLLRVLEETEICMVGSAKSRHVNVRIVAASNSMTPRA